MFGFLILVISVTVILIKILLSVLMCFVVKILNTPDFGCFILALTDDVGRRGFSATV